jgi:aryl-alcohol dehydrogenase-like predicted oxidoreductase
MDHGTIAGVERPVSRLIQGTLRLHHVPDDEAFALFDDAFEVGYDAFDTAAVYSRGRSESLLGEWLERRGLRHEVTIIDKGCHPAGDTPRMTPRDLEEDLRGSLERLRTDHVDLYVLHRDDPSVPVDEMVSALNDQLRAGAIRAYGASNWTHERIRAAIDHAKANGLVPFAASSPGFSLADPIRSWPRCLSLSRVADAAAFEWYRANDLPFLAWSPLAGGFLTGRYTRENLHTFETPGERQVVEFYASEKNLERLERLAAWSRARGLTLSQAALAYVMSVPLNMFGVIGARDRAELVESAGALALRLDESELAALEGVDAP